MSKALRMVYQTEETRNLILQRAEEVFVARGFFDAQMKDIGEAIGMSSHTLYRYFQDKVDLGMAIAERILIAQSSLLSERLSELIEQSDRSGLDRLKEFLLKDAMRLMDGDDGRFIAEFDAYFSSQRAPSNFRESLGAPVMMRTMESILVLIEQGQADGSVRRDLTAQQLLQTVMGLRAMQKEIVLRGELLFGVDAEEAGELPAQMAEVLIAGMCSKVS